MFSLPVLIARGLDLQYAGTALYQTLDSLFSFQGAIALNMARWSSGQDGGLSRPNREFDSPSGHHYAPLAQLVEHLTLNQGVQGSSP